MTPLSPSRAIQLFDEVKTEHVWNVRRISDVILSMYFGPPHLVVREPRPDLIKPETSPAVARVYRRRLAVPKGPWRLFVEDGLWRVQVFGLECARGDADRAKVERCLTKLSGQKLTDVAWDPRGKVWSFAFDLDGLITITADPVIDRSSGEEWIFFREGRSNLVCRRDDDLTLDAASHAAHRDDRDMQIGGNEARQAAEPSADLS